MGALVLRQISQRFSEAFHGFRSKCRKIRTVLWGLRQQDFHGLKPYHAVLAAAMTFAACTTTKGTFCQLADPIRLRPEIIDQLSDHELKQALALNEKGRKLCGWEP